MKNLFFVSCLFCLTLLSCQKQDELQPETILSVAITEQPIGGLNVPTVSATYIGTITGTVEPVDVTVEWFVESLTQENTFAINTQTIKFSEGTSIAKTTACPVLDPYRYSVYYWVKFTWTDDKGKHSIQSNKAFCEKKPV